MSQDKLYPIPGGTYKHYKGSAVKVLEIGIIEGSGETAVVYRHVDEASPIWIRTLSEWLREVPEMTLPNGSKKPPEPRFVRAMESTQR